MVAHNLVEMRGKSFGRLTVLSRAKSKPNGDAVWVCKCSCGKELSVLGRGLRSGASLSCGCLRIENAIKVSTKHGHASSGKNTREYKSWAAMRVRCGNPSHRNFKDYGGRGIKVCERWADSFENFLADMGQRPPRHSLDRINVNGGYEPDNCRWADAKTQANNTRRNLVRIALAEGKQS